MSLKVQIEGLQIFFKQQKQKSKEEKMKRRKRTFVIFCLNFFEKETLTLFIFKPIFFSFLFHFKWCKNVWLGIYKTFLSSKCNKTIITKLSRHSKLWYFIINVFKKIARRPMVHYSCIIVDIKHLINLSLVKSKHHVIKIVVAI